MSPVLLSDASRVTLGRPTAPAADLRADAMLVTHGRAGTEPLVAAALLIDAVRSGHLDVAAPPHLVALTADATPRPTAPRAPRVVASRSTAADPILLADLRAHVLTGPPGTPLHWIERTAESAPHRVATELVTAGLAMPLSPRFGRTFTLSINARAEAAARARIAADPALAVLLYAYGLSTGDPLPPSAHSLPPAEREILAALRVAAGGARLAG
jgi:hypothetical protein